MSNPFSSVIFFRNFILKYYYKEKSINEKKHSGAHYKWIDRISNPLPRYEIIDKDLKFSLLNDMILKK